MNRIALIAVAGLGLTLAACGDNTSDDVVQAPAPGSALEPVTETRADVATTQTAVALGMTVNQLEDAYLLSPERTKLGEVDRLVLGPDNVVTHLVIDLEGPGDDVLLPMDQVTSITIENEPHLQTPLSAAQLAAMPRYDPNTPVAPAS